ncbi:antitoxin VbhA family protein [Virgibacillus sp. 6R]|uniref:antitoxin VbhA family protein n=1 Tax=Metabacillus sp. 22489 TaxID=3453928 RepID=UPI001642D801
MRNFNSAKASVEMEGFVISKEIEELVLKNVHGEITDEEFIKLLCEIAEKV